MSVFDLLFNFGLFPYLLLQIIELSPLHIALLDHHYSFYGRRVQRKDPLHPFAVRDLANRECLSEAGSFFGNDYTLKSLRSGLAFFDDLDENVYGIAYIELGDILLQ